MSVWGCMVDSLSDGLWVVAQLFWLECIRTAMVDPWEAIACGANVPGTASPSDPQQCVSGAPLRQALAVPVPARRRWRCWRREAGQPQCAALSLVHRWCESACPVARDTLHGAGVALPCAIRLCHNVWRDFNLDGASVGEGFSGGGVQDQVRGRQESRARPN